MSPAVCRRAAALLGGLLLVASAAAVPVCTRHASSAAVLERLAVAMGEGRFIAYQLTSLTVRDSIR